MKTSLRNVLAAAIVASANLLSVEARAQSMMYPGVAVGLDEEESRFLPGLYYFNKGCDYEKRGDTKAAIDAWEIAAGWAMKDAQLKLGLAYFQGKGVDADRPRGLAWLALAAERKDASYEAVLATAWDEASASEHDRANALWRELRKANGDDTALPRARNRFTTELDRMTGSHIGGQAHVWTRARGKVDLGSYKAELLELAERNFGRPAGAGIGRAEPATD